MAGAYILAGELGRSQGDYRAAFELYEKAFRPFIERKQKSARAFAGSFTPATSLGLAIRDVVLHLTAIPAVADYLMHRFVSDRFTLPDYGDAAASA
jgi:2-polyprenyl-6-methoxyphenol hydroxylase-like FAD-dependent oxidoreductase